MQKTLFDLGQEMLDLEEQLDEADLDNEETARILDTWLNQADRAVDAKVDAYAGLIHELEARSDVRAAEARRMKGRADVDAHKADALKARLKAFFEATSTKTVETPRFRVTLAGNGGKQPVWVDAFVKPHQVPEEYRRVTVVIDRQAVHAALVAGEELTYPSPTGERIEWARLEPRGSSIRIK